MAACVPQTQVIGSFSNAIGNAYLSGQLQTCLCLANNTPIVASKKKFDLYFCILPEILQYVKNRFRFLSLSLFTHGGNDLA